MPDAGDTFLLANQDINNHLWIIISNPLLDSEQIVTVNFTSWQPYKDQSCIVEVGEHPFIRNKTCISYIDSKLITATQYDDNLLKSFIIPHSPISENLMARILISAAESHYLSLGHYEILEKQELVH